jgi:hypothetical protein
MARPRALFQIALLLIAISLSAGSAPVLDAFTANPATALPGQNVALKIEVHDPDCTAPPCTSGCGVLIRPDLLTFSDGTGRTPSPFTGTKLTASSSPWSATTNWLAPAAEGVYTISASVSDNGGSLCGGRQTRLVTLQISVGNSRPPLVDSCTVDPSTVPAGGTATLAITATDPLGRTLAYSFSAEAGTIAHASPSARTATWTAPKSSGTFVLRCRAEAGGAYAVGQTTGVVEIGVFLRKLATANLRITRVAPLPDGRIAAVDGANGVLVLMTQQGNVAWRKIGLESPVAVAVSGGEILVLERRASRISVWSLSGERLRELPTAIAMPNQLVVGPGNGELALTDTDAARVMIVSARDGALLRTVGNGMLKLPVGLAVSEGMLAVADSGSRRVLLYAPDGVLMKTLGDDTTFVRPQGLSWDISNDRFVVTDSFTGNLVIVGEEGLQRGTLGGFGTEQGQLINPIDVSLLAGNVLAVTTTGGDVLLYQLLSTLAPVQPPTAVIAGDRLNDDGGAVAVSWTASSDDPARVTRYRIERATGDSEAFAVAGTVASSTTSFIDATVANGTCYRYRVVATDDSTEAAAEPTGCATARNDLPPPSPGNALAERVTPSSAVIRWDAVQALDLQGYAVEISSQGGATRNATSSTPSLSLSELTPDTPYSVSVRAVDTAGNHSAPATFSFATYPDTPPPAPLAVSAKDAETTGEIVVSWTVPESRVPIESYRVECSPSVAGWPAPSFETAATELRVRGLVNTLSYSITVSATTPWERTGDASAPVNVTPTAAPGALPLVERSKEIEDAGGVAAHFTIEAEKRELRLQYSASGTVLQIRIDGAAVGSPLPDTGGAWVDAAVAVEKKLLKAGPTHLLELSSSAFPDPNARLAVRRVDFVPLPPLALKWDAYNTVVDLVWSAQEWREDLTVRILRDDKVDIVCAEPRLGRCRDTFLENDRKSVWSVATVSPAGWSSDPSTAQGHAKFDEMPPPVTDVVITPFEDGHRLTWTPLSSAASKNAAPAAVRSYRIFAAGALVTEVDAPPAFLRGVDPAAVVVRSVDAQGRESQ